MLTRFFAASCLLLSNNLCPAQNAQSLSQVKKIFVAPMGSGKLGSEFRDRMIARLRKDSNFEIVNAPKQADAVVAGTGQIWVTGYVTDSPHTPATTRRAVYNGYLSARLTGKNDETLWSYLVTPSKFPWGGIVQDLANSLAAKLIEARREKGEPDSGPAPSTTTTQVSLHGAGATFPAPLYQKWFQSFQERNAGGLITYDPVGSETGIHELAAHSVDFAASDMPLSDEQMSHLNTKFAHFASVLGAVVPIYNLKGVTRTLNFTPEALAGIYLGKIKRWNDPKIRASNRGVSLPDEEIVVVHRSDGSGTTFVWSDFLAKVSPEWKATVGVGDELKWPVGRGSEHNEGVAVTVQQTPNSIGYVEMVYALQHELSFGAVRNAASEFVRADLSSVTAAAISAASDTNSDFRISITNAPGKGAYPVVSFTWLLFPLDAGNSARKSQLVELLQWILTSGQKDCAELGYAPLPRSIADRELQALSAIK